MALDNAFPSSATNLTTTTQWEALLRGMSASGVLAGVRNEFAPSLNSGSRTVVIDTGAAQIRGFHTDGFSTTSTAIPAADTQNRVDRLVLRLNRAASLAADWIKPVVITGTPAASPQIPALTQTDSGLYDLPICRWTSASSGSLTGLVDERYLAGGETLALHSTARPSASIRRVGIEIDTGKVVFSDGSAWRNITDDTGWVSYSVQGSWAADGPNPLEVRRINGVVHMRGVVNRTSTTLSASDDDSPVATLPAGFRPAGWHYYSTWLYPGSCLMRIGTDGDVRLRSHGSDVPVGRSLYLATSFMTP